MKKTRIDTTSTTVEWSRVKSGMCVLPVGSMEQHSDHLPVGTDSILVGHFARVISGEFGAAMLPVIPIMTSYEHTGFAGSFSFRPETAIAVIRDIVDEAERQAFHTMIIVNGHGGNFILSPIVRDINRMDRRIKILLCFPYMSDKMKDHHDIHAGLNETSLMMHLHPDLVKRSRKDIGKSEWLTGEFVQTDLNHYGLGRISPRGAVGYPTRASAAFGSELVADMERLTIAWVGRRLKWLKANRSYRGNGGNTGKRAGHGK